uniref:Uncharacterized protein n=1 Tax=Trichinella nativa TaxID=6335 RepID=A0A0V1KJU4_9BILA
MTPASSEAEGLLNFFPFCFYTILGVDQVDLPRSNLKSSPHLANQR